MEIFPKGPIPIVDFLFPNIHDILFLFGGPNLKFGPFVLNFVTLSSICEYKHTTALLWHAIIRSVNDATRLITHQIIVENDGKIEPGACRGVESGDVFQKTIFGRGRFDVEFA